MGGMVAATIRVNGESEPFTATTLAALPQEKALDTGQRGIAVALNGAVVPRAAWAETALKAGDSVDVEPETWRRVLDINLNGTFYACQSFGRRALARGSGSAVLVSSMSASIVNVPQFQASYHASKAGVSMLAQALGVEWAPRGVRVNAIAPGYMLSEMTRQFTEANPDLARQWTSAIPLGRMGQPEDLHGLVGFLASDASGYLTSQSIVIDGGYTAL